MRNFILFLLFVFVSTGCGQKNDPEPGKSGDITYEVRNDSLFLGYYFGMPAEEFFDHSWSLNKEGLLLNGSGAEIIRYVDDLKSRAKMSFYPEFNDRKIYQMPIVYSYNGWAPWNRHLFSDSLQQDLKYFFADSMNIVFEETFHPEDSTLVLSATKQNKEITISLVDQSKVKVTFKDLSTIEN